MNPTKDQTATLLANKHFAIEPGIIHIFRLRTKADDEARDAEPIKLLEVSEHTIPMGIRPIGFGPIARRGIPYSSVVIEVSPEEFGRIQSGELLLPNGWVIDAELRKPVELEEVA
jgi:hypothetical protein